jgi:hypothetical protein
MKVVASNLAPALTSGGLDAVNMGISTDPEDQLMILNVLSNSLYTDKVSAVLREYGCNAFDANVEAGRGQQPIEVRLPNKLEAVLSIRDFGYGMTEEQILTVFCRLGRSTKRASNAFTGMLGIGSKAGFAYGDSFTVTSFTNGIKSVYTAFRERGAPRLAKQDERPTDSPDGIEVKVPVRVEDIAEFQEKAERVFRYFKVRPIIHGHKIAFTNDEKKFEGTGWRYTGSGRSYAVMGNVGYDLNDSSMGTTTETVRTLIRLGVELDFEIGELEIAANREGLQYKDLTKKNVADRLTVLAAEVGSIFTKQIAAATTLWEARKLYGQIFERQGDYSLTQLRNLVGGHIIWNGVQINTGRFYIGNKEKDPSVISVMEIGKRSWGRSPLQATLSAEYCYASDKTQFVVNDLPTKKHSPSRVKGFFAVNPTMDSMVILTFLNDKTQAKYWKARELDGVIPIMMSAIVPAISVMTSTSGPSAHKAKHSAKAFVLNEKCSNSDRSTKSLFWETEDIDCKDGEGVYVALEKFCVIQPPMAIAPRYYENTPHFFIHQVVKGLRKSGLLDPSERIFGFKQTWLEEKKRLGKGWITLEDHLKAVVKKMCEKDKLAQEVADYFASASYKEFMDEEVLKVAPKGMSLHTLLTELKRMRHPKISTDTLLYLHENKGIPWVDAPTVPKPSVNLDILEKQVRADYPLLHHWADDRVEKLQNLGGSELDVAIDYIKMVDSQP